VSDFFASLFLLRVDSELGVSYRRHDHLVGGRPSRHPAPKHPTFCMRGLLVLRILFLVMRDLVTRVACCWNIAEFDTPASVHYLRAALIHIINDITYLSITMPSITIAVAVVGLIITTSSAQCVEKCMSYASERGASDVDCTRPTTPYYNDPCVCNSNYRWALSRCASTYTPCSTGDLGASMIASWKTRCDCVCTDRVADLLSCSQSNVFLTKSHLTTDSLDPLLSYSETYVMTVSLPPCLCDSSLDERFFSSLSSCVSTSSRVCGSWSDVDQVLSWREMSVSLCPGWVPTAPCTCGAVAASAVSCGGAMSDSSCLCAPDARTAFLASLSSCVDASRYCDSYQAEETAEALLDLCDGTYTSGMGVVASVAVVGFAVFVMAGAFVFYKVRKNKMAGECEGGEAVRTQQGGDTSNTSPTFWMRYAGAIRRTLG